MGSILSKKSKPIDVDLVVSDSGRDESPSYNGPVSTSDSNDSSNDSNNSNDDTSSTSSESSQSSFDMKDINDNPAYRDLQKYIAHMKILGLKDSIEHLKTNSGFPITRANFSEYIYEPLVDWESLLIANVTLDDDFNKLLSEIHELSLKLYSKVLLLNHETLLQTLQDQKAQIGEKEYRGRKRERENVD